MAGAPDKSPSAEPVEVAEKYSKTAKAVLNMILLRLVTKSRYEIVECYRSVLVRSVAPAGVTEKHKRPDTGLERVIQAGAAHTDTAHSAELQQECRLSK